MDLYAKELLLYPILRNINEGIILTDTSHTTVFFNERAEDIYGLTAASVIGKHIDNIKPRLYFSQMINNRQRLIEDKEFINGKQINITKGLLELAPGQFACYAILQQDDRLEDYQLSSFLQSPYEGIVIFDLNLYPVFANDVCYRFLKCKTKDELINELNPIVARSNLEDSLNRGKPMAGQMVSIRGQMLEVLYLPVIRQGRAVGIIAKTVPVFRPEPSWGELVDQYNLGTASYSFDHIVGNDPKMVQLKELSSRAARTVSTVLLKGESGTGKEIFAHAIHNVSPRRRGPFIKVNCAAVPETLLESELFGYAEGAFTGARKDGKPGKFELANHGTIFLDEIGDMSLSMQAKLLRVLQEKEVERVGGVSTTKVDVRVIAATNQDLFKLAQENKFREDLYYRLNVIIMEIPPLRERLDDIPLISKTLLQRLNTQLGTRVNTISPEVLTHFGNYTWPGNIRELENTIERAINFCDGNTIALANIPEHIISLASAPPLHSPGGFLENLLEAHEKEVIVKALEKCGGNRTKTAETLNIHRSVLYRKMNKYKISSN
ncbi:MAG: sigma 54-interacting transcriptional regulator [Syntrophomonadaceae bacterium]|nr:sigma 54-interacting transcriptional regulator [Syntrophomonadaceae bacterium]